MPEVTGKAPTEVNFTVSPTEKAGVLDGIPADIATLNTATKSILSSRGISPGDVVFSGFSKRHAKAADGEFGSTDGTSSFFFGSKDSLAPPNADDPDEVAQEKIVVNPFVYAMQGGSLGVYSTDGLKGLAGQGVLVDENDPNSNDLLPDDFGVLQLRTSPNDLGKAQLMTIDFDTVPEVGAISRKETVGDVAVKSLIEAPTPSNGEQFTPDIDTLIRVLGEYPEQLVDPVKRLQFMKDLSVQELFSGLDMIHAMLTPKEVHEKLNDKPAQVGLEMGTGNTDQKEFVTTQLFVSPEDRQHFSEYVKEKIDGSTSLEAVADIVAFAVLNLHMYADGNGRTARVLHDLIVNGYDGSEYSRSRLFQTATNRATIQGRRPLSFNVEQLLKGAVLNSVLPQLTEDTELFKESLKSGDRSNTPHVSGSIFEGMLKGVEDPSIRQRLTRVVQQSSFGDVAIQEIMQRTSRLSDMDSVDTYMRLGSISDEQARSIIQLDQQMRLVYMKALIAVASGEKVEYYDRFTGQQKTIGPEGLTMSTEWQKRYLS